MKTVLCFGTFDQLDEAHRKFLHAAEALGDYLRVSVARDAHVRTLKHKEPKQDERTRLKAILSLLFVDEAELSDEQLGSYRTVLQMKPDLIALGYDQDKLEEDLKAFLLAHELMIPIVRIGRFPETYG